MATLRKSSADEFPHVSEGDTVVLLKGTHRPFQVPGLPGLTIFGEGDRNDVTVKGSLHPGGGEPPCTIRVHDGAVDLSMANFGVRGSAGRGLRITDAPGLKLTNLRAWENQIEGIILGNCPGALLTLLDAGDSEPGGDYSPDKVHALYISGNCEGTVLTQSVLHGVTGSCLQINSVSLGFTAYKLTVEDVVLEKGGSGGTPMLSLMGVQDSHFRRLAIREGNAGITMFADGKPGEKRSCLRNSFENLLFTNVEKWICREREGSGENTYTGCTVDGSDWSGPGE